MGRCLRISRVAVLRRRWRVADGPTGFDDM
jgi:hypothetical protein